MQGEAIIAHVTRDEYRQILNFCRQHDCKRRGPGNVYDAFNGGLINVWSEAELDREDRAKREAKPPASLQEALTVLNDKDRWSMHCSYLWRRGDGKHLGESFEEKSNRQFAQLADDADYFDGRTGEATIERSLFDVLSAGCDKIVVIAVPGQHGTGPERWGADRDWTSQMAQEYFRMLFLNAVGRPMLQDELNDLEVT